MAIKSISIYSVDSRETQKSHGFWIPRRFCNNYTARLPLYAGSFITKTPPFYINLHSKWPSILTSTTLITQRLTFNFGFNVFTRLLNMLRAFIVPMRKDILFRRLGLNYFWSSRYIYLYKQQRFLFLVFTACWFFFSSCCFVCNQVVKLPRCCIN